MIDIRGVPKIDMARYMETLNGLQLFERRLARQQGLAERQLHHKNFKGYGETLSEVRLLKSLLGSLKKELGIA